MADIPKWAKYDYSREEKPLYDVNGDKLIGHLIPVLKDNEKGWYFEPISKEYENAFKDIRH